MQERILLLTDLDGTLIKGDSYILFLRFVSGSFLKFIFKGIQAMPILLMWKLGIRSTGKAKGQILGAYISDRKKDSMIGQAETFVNKILLSRVRKNVMDKVKYVQSKGGVCAIVSASPELWVGPLAKEMGMEFISSKLEYKEGIFKGRLEGENCKGEEKVKAILERYSPSDYDEVWTLGDSSADLPMIMLGTRKWYKDFD